MFEKRWMADVESSGKQNLPRILASEKHRSKHMTGRLQEKLSLDLWICLQELS